MIYILQPARIFVLFTIGLLLVAQTALSDDIPLNDQFWTLRGEGAKFTQYKGRDAVYLNGASAVLNDMIFRDGIIEYDVAFSHERGFASVVFRRNEETSTAENFYIRTHQSGNPDANQYQPIFHGNSAWQIYHGPQYTTILEYPENEWVHVKVVVKDSKADIYIDSEEPNLHVDLLVEPAAGGLSLGTVASGAYFSNVRVEPNASVETKGSPVPHDPLPESLIRQWAVSEQAFASADFASADFASADFAGVDFAGVANLSAELTAGVDWQVLDVEANGIANLGRVGPRTPEKDTRLVRLVINADRATTTKMTFGFSDQLVAYLNGRPVYGGSDVYASRDYRFLGTVGLFDTLYLPLKEGRNEVIFAVTEVFGGWAIVGTLDEGDGISLSR